jgi:hypothetical protein
VVHQYVTTFGINPFEKWFNRLEPVAAAKVATALYKIEISKKYWLEYKLLKKKDKKPCH